MANSAKKSFDIFSARDYLDGLLRPAYTDFIKDALSSRKAITCVVYAWHLTDWIWAQHKTELQKNPGLKKKRDYIQFLFAMCPELEVLQDLANGSKHFKSDRSTVEDTKLSHGHASGLLLAFTQSHLIVRTGKATYFIENLLEKVIANWDAFFASYLTPP